MIAATHDYREYIQNSSSCTKWLEHPTHQKIATGLYWKFIRNGPFNSSTSFCFHQN